MTECSCIIAALTVNAYRGASVEVHFPENQLALRAATI